MVGQALEPGVASRPLALDRLRWNQIGSLGVGVNVRSSRTSRIPATPAGRTFEEFFIDVWPWAYRLASFMTQDPALGEEIAQSSLANMCRTWGRVDRPEAYLRTSIVNASRNWRRRERIRRVKLPLVAAPDQVAFAAEELADVIARLPFRQRAVIVLRYYFDLTESEIAAALECRPGTVKSLASRALERLRKELQP